MQASTEFTGRLTRDVTNVYSNDDGTAKRAIFSVACNSYFKDKDGEKKEKCDFIPCIVWGDKFVDMITQWGLKGRQVHIKGVLDTYQAPPDENGAYPPQKIQVRVTPGGFEFLDKKPETATKETPKPAETAQNGTVDLKAIAKLVAAEMLQQVNTPVETPTTPSAENALGSII